MRVPAGRLNTMNDGFSATAGQIAAADKMKRELTEEQKQKLRDRLTLARAKRSAMSKAGTLKARPKKATPPPPPLPTAPSTFAKWSDTEWLSSPYDQALQRLTDLYQDRERGAVLVTQRQASERIAPTYKCLVCHKPVQDGRWIWKNDRRDHITGMFTSDVMCSQKCYERFANNQKFYMDRAKAVS